MFWDLAFTSKDRSISNTHLRCNHPAVSCTVRERTVYGFHHFLTQGSISCLRDTLTLTLPAFAKACSFLPSPHFLSPKSISESMRSQYPRDNAPFHNVELCFTKGSKHILCEGSLKGEAGETTTTEEVQGFNRDGLLQLSYDTWIVGVEPPCQNCKGETCPYSSAWLGKSSQEDLMQYSLSVDLSRRMK